MVVESSREARMADKFILSIDLGTSGPKVALFSTQGELLGSGCYFYSDTFYSFPRPPSVFEGWERVPRRGG